MRLLIALFIAPLSVLAQATGEVDYPYLGIKFTIPSGWVGQELEEGYLMGSETEPGFILMMTHEATKLDELKAEAEKGIHEAGGTSFSLQGALDQISHEAVGGRFSGTLEYNKAEAYIGAMINPFGTGVTVMVVTNPESYGARQEELAMEVLKSLRFAQPKENPVVKDWSETLQGAKLTYLSTTGGLDVDGYSGSSSREEILLCGNQFTYYNSYHASFDDYSGSASASSDDSGQGNWKVQGDDEEVYLILSFNDGRLSEYRLEYKDEKTLLSGSRYFRTYDHGECY